MFKSAGMYIPDCGHSLSFPVIERGSDPFEATPFTSHFSLVCLVLHGIFPVGRAEDSRIPCIDPCIRTLYSAVRVDVGHSTSFKDPLVLLKYTQDNLESNLSRVLFLPVCTRGWEGRETREQFCSNLQGGKQHSAQRKSNSILLSRNAMNY